MVKFIKKNYPYICILICFFVLMWRAFLGFCWSDECFYVSTADRFYRGATPLVDEWYRTQMSSVLMLPFYALYMLIVGSNTGVILYFRLLYLVLSLAVSVVCFKVLRREYPAPVSLIASILIMCYAHLNNATFSYYMLSYMLLTLALLLIYDYTNSRRRGEAVCAGVIAALAVLCMPAFAAGYIVIIVLAGAYLLVNRLFKLPGVVTGAADPSKLSRTLLWTGVGILAAALIFATYLFSRISLDSLMKILPYSLVDNEHSETIGYYIRKPHRCFKEVFGNLTWAMYGLAALSFIFGNKLKKYRGVCLIIAADVVIFCIAAYMGAGKTGYIQAVFFMFMLPVYFISEKKNHRLFLITVIPSILVALIYSSTSSDFLYVMAIGFAIGQTAGVCAVYDHIKGNVTHKAIEVLLYAVCIFTLGITFSLRLINVYRDAPVNKLSHVITCGVAKGLFTTEEHMKQYDEVCDVIDGYINDPDRYETISGNPDGNVLFSKILPWGYAVSTPDCGYPTTWRATAYDKEQLDIYYSLNKTARPDVIMVLDEQYGSYDAAGDTQDDHNPNLDEMSGYWKDYIRDNGMTETKVECGKIYYIPRKGKAD